MPIRLKRGDQVLVIAGKDKGKTGVLSAIISKTNRVVVEGVNSLKRHRKVSLNQPSGGIVSFWSPIDRSNIQVVCPTCAQPTRIKIKLEPSGKLRLCLRCQASLDSTKPASAAKTKS